MGFALDLESLIDCQFKRINEHRRQFMDALYLIHRYFQESRRNAHGRQAVLLLPDCRESHAAQGQTHEALFRARYGVQGRGAEADAPVGQQAVELREPLFLFGGLLVCKGGCLGSASSSFAGCGALAPILVEGVW